jgi:hypothetical protein
MMSLGVTQRSSTPDKQSSDYISSSGSTLKDKCANLGIKNDY